jgi:hypothetical protein
MSPRNGTGEAPGKSVTERVEIPNKSFLFPLDVRYKYHIYDELRVLLYPGIVGARKKADVACKNSPFTNLGSTGSISPKGYESK